jgi:hypothetical protein
MQRQERRPNWPALGLATALALAVTTGVPALMQAGAPVAPHVDAVAAARHTPATEVSIEPRRIEVVATRERNQVSRWFSVVGTRSAS